MMYWQHAVNSILKMKELLTISEQITNSRP
jgi:hypothetical protein